MTNQQALVLRELRSGQRTTRELAEALGISIDATRNCATRMEGRGWLSGMGNGTARKWTITGVGNSAWEQEGAALVGPTAGAGEDEAATSRSQSGPQRVIDVDPETGDVGEREETDDERATREAAAAEGSAEGGPTTRTYIVLEELGLHAIVAQTLEKQGHSFDAAVLDPILDALEGTAVYAIVNKPTARNTEHAFRKTAKTVYKGTNIDEPVLVAVAVKMFQPTPVNVNNTQTVSIGKPRQLA